jgi:uncharacterized protein (TIGR02444 family)
LTREALWPFALEVYGRPGVEALLLELQDHHGQCVPFLLWSLWMAASGRVANPAKFAACAELSRAWQDAAVAPLRTLRRHLKRPAGSKAAEARTRIRAGVKALELDAERMLLQMLEEASPPPGDAPTGDPDSLRSAVRAWGGEAPAGLLEQLARLAA